MGKALVLCADGCEESEALLVVDILRRAGITTQTVSVNETHRVVSLHDVVIQTDLTIKDVDEKGVELCVLFGGLKGVDVLMANGMAKKLCRDLAAQGKRLAAVCGGPAALAGYGVLDGYHATVFPALKDKLCGAISVDYPVVVDRNITTGRALGSTIPFALSLVRQLAGDEAVTKVRSAIVFHDPVEEQRY